MVNYNDTVIIDRRLDLMLAFGYSVEFTSRAINVYCTTNTHGTDGHGCIIWKKDGRFHRNDGPAIVSTLGDLYVHDTCVARYAWQRHGLLHRTDGPSDETLESCPSWNQHGEFHRLDGPADMCHDGIFEWYQAGDQHRLDGPAAIDSDGEIGWYIYDKRHRIDGPAVIGPYGGYEFHQYGEEIQ